MHPTITGNNPVHLINQPDTLQQSLEEIERCRSISFDLEFDNNSYHYGITLCLLQVATPHACYVIDGLANLDLSRLYALFESAGIQKIVHASGEDLRLLHSLGCFPKNLFDTEVAARLLNYEATSLSVLLQEKLNVRLDKKQQRSNWHRRPLLDAQVQYAAEDVMWLHPLKALLEAEAGKRDLLPFLREEQELLSTTLYPPVVKTNFLKPADLNHLSPRDQYVVNELLRYRDSLARHLNRPAYQVMREELVKDLAAGTRTPESIVQEPGVHPRFKNTHFALQLARELERARKAAAAQNLSSQRQRPPKQTSAQQAAGRQSVNDRETIFAPIKKVLEQRFGRHAATFLFSNKIINELLKGTITLQDLKPAYRQALIRQIAAEAGISLDRYAGENKPH